MKDDELEKLRGQLLAMNIMIGALIQSHQDKEALRKAFSDLEAVNFVVGLEVAPPQAVRDERAAILLMFRRLLSAL